MIRRVAASFRDPSGFVYFDQGKLLRQVNQVYQSDYDLLLSSGLFKKLVGKRWLVNHTECDEKALDPETAYKILCPEQIGFISYPYEWSFSQLKDAALLTLAIEKEALTFGMALKDASAYNIQFHNGAPILIDTLSFAKYVEGEPWVAYRQFCQHFLAPLALMAKVDRRLNKELINYIDGIPLDLCSAMLPRATRYQVGLAMHIHMHAKAQAQSERAQSQLEPPAEQKAPVRIQKVSKVGLIGLIESLEGLVRGLECKITGTMWADYYSATNYSDTAFEEKKALVTQTVTELKPRLVYDLGANTGIFSRAAAQYADTLVIASDIDPEAVELNYRELRKDGVKNILPLVIDLTNPSPAIGWDNSERDAYLKRDRADLVLALALVHHLAIANNVPLGSIAESFAKIGEYLLIEFVPKEDSQVKRLLRTRADIFHQYTLEGLLHAFEPYFKLVKQTPIANSQRTMLLFKAK
ncbi:MAG: SAM-dependent methyltransferase [Anaerolineaceae bacterium]